MSYVNVKNISKVFSGKLALSNVSFSIHQGELFGLMGPNGSGKSTCLSILAGLLSPFSGSVAVADVDVRANNIAVRRLMAYVFQELSLDRKLSVRSNLHFIGAIRGLSKKQINQRISEIFSLLELPGIENTIVIKLSGGMRRLVELVSVLLARPHCLFMDEPTMGLDIAYRKQFWHFVEKLRKEYQLTVVFSSHHLEEAESCQRIALLDHGQLQVVASPEKLLAEMTPYILEAQGRELEKYWPQSSLHNAPKLYLSDKWYVQLKQYQYFEAMPAWLPSQFSRFEIRKTNMSDVFLWRTQ